jgi:hypothetical protein
MADALGNVNVGPGSGSSPYTTNLELLAATGSGYNQDGVTLANTQGVLAVGAPIYKDASGYYRQVYTKTVADGATTSGSATVTSATYGFTSKDVGAFITGTGIPANATVSSVTNATTIVISANASATGSGVSITLSQDKNCSGFLRHQTDTSALDGYNRLGNRVFRGVLKYSVIKAANGAVDLSTNLLTALGARVDTVRDYLIF